MREVRIDLIDGEFADEMSWIYVWMRADTGAIFYVGATPLPPAVRTWLHLHDEDPDIGRVRAQRPDALQGEVIVRAFELGPGFDRQEVKRALIRLMKGETGQGPAFELAGVILDRLRVQPSG